MIPVFSTAILGAIIGAIGNVIMPSHDKGGRITSATLGLCGASLFTQLGWLQGFYAPGATVGYAVGIAGAVLLLLVYRLIVGLRIAE